MDIVKRLRLRPERETLYLDGCVAAGYGPTIEAQAADEIDRLRRERDALAADAARYRYLRNRNRDDVLLKSGPSAGVWCDCEDEEGSLTLLTGEDLDSDIDAWRPAKGE